MSTPCWEERAENETVGETAASANAFYVDSAFFDRYDQLQAACALLEGTEERCEEATKRLNQAEQELIKSEERLKENRRFTKEQIDRIHCVSTHWFFGTTAFQPQLWFRGGCSGKIHRAEIKLQRSQAETPALETAVVQLRDVDLPPLRLEVQELTNKQSQRTHLIAEQGAMFERAVTSHATPELYRLQLEETKLDMEATDLNQDARTLEKIAHEVRACERKYTKALELHQKAKDLAHRKRPSIAPDHPLLNPSYVSRQESSSIPGAAMVPIACDPSVLDPRQSHCRSPRRYRNRRCGRCRNRSGFYDESAYPTPVYTEGLGGGPRSVPVVGDNPGRSAFVQRVLDEQRRQRERYALTPNGVASCNTFITHTKYSNWEEETLLETVRADGLQEFHVEWKDRNGHVSSGKLCPSACGYLVTHRGTHCCQKCQMGEGQHGARCQRATLHHHHYYGPDAAADYLMKEYREQAIQSLEACQRETFEVTDQLEHALATIPISIRERYPESCSMLFNHTDESLPSLQHKTPTRGRRGRGSSRNGTKDATEWDQRAFDLIGAALIKHKATSSEIAATVRSLADQCQRDAYKAFERKSAVSHAITGEKNRVFDELRGIYTTQHNHANHRQAPSAPVMYPPLAPAATHGLVNEGDYIQPASVEPLSPAMHPVAVATPAMLNEGDNIPMVFATTAEDSANHLNPSFVSTPANQMRSSFAATPAVAEDGANSEEGLSPARAQSAPMEDDLFKSSTCSVQMY